MLLDRRAPGRPLPPDRHELNADLHSEDGITRQASTFDRRDVLREIAAAHREGATVADIEALADGWLATPDVMRLERGDKRPHLGGARHSTRDMIELEQRIVRDAVARKGAGVAVVSPTTRDEAPKAASPISGEQAELVRRVTQSGDGVEVVRAPAGTGKTRALDVARIAWESTGVRVFGCALAARAAIELESTAGIDSTTIARLLQDVDHGHGLPTGSVLVVDEAGMVGSRTIDRLARHAAETESKLLLVGDDRQLPEIDAGGAFRGLADHLGAAELKTVRRQSEQWDRDALAHLRVGKVQAWLGAYRDHGRIIARPTADQTRAALVDGWWEAARTNDQDAVMIAHRRADVGELNALARARMQRDGRLGTDQLVTAGGRPFAVGDHVLARRNDRRADVVNGLRARVVEVDAERRTLRIETTDGMQRALDSRYLDEGWLDHGYALTAHAAQGATVDRSFVLGSDELYREWGYTALTRHTSDAHFYVVSTGSAERALPGLGATPDPLAQDVTTMLAASRRKQMATEIARIHPSAEPDRSQPLSPTHDEAADEIDVARTRIAVLTQEREGLRPWQRARRRELDELVAEQRESIARWEADRRTEEAPVDRSMRRDDVTDHWDLRASLLSPPPELTARIGERPETLSEREMWCRAAANLLGDLPAPPAAGPSLDTLADIGPEL